MVVTAMTSHIDKRTTRGPPSAPTPVAQADELAAEARTPPPHAARSIVIVLALSMTALGGWLALSQVPSPTSPTSLVVGAVLLVVGVGLLTRAVLDRRTPPHVTPEP